jgi:hypothetical protein
MLFYKLLISQVLIKKAVNQLATAKVFYARSFIA